MAKTQKFMVLLIPYTALLFSTILCYCKCENASSMSGFTTDLIHRDSPISPLYDPSLTQEQRLANARKRSLARSRRHEDILYGTPTPEVALVEDRATYLMQFYMGTPLKHAMMLLDPGSPMIWTQCLPCKRCKPQKFPFFDPQASSTYRSSRCGSAACRAIGGGYCDPWREMCLFKSKYREGSYSDGVVGTDTFTFHSGERGLMSFPKIVFGCGLNNHVSFEGPESGIVGLGVGPTSLHTQLGYDKFSYCLVPAAAKFETSTMHFGSDAVVSGWGVVSTPLAERGVFRYVTLEAISVGNKRFRFGANMAMDSGSVISLLPVKIYDELEVEISNSIPQRAVRDYLDWRLCYSDKFVMPKITVHFQGADVEWTRQNAFVRVNADYECLAVEPTDGAFHVYGGVAQSNYLVGFDVTRKTVSFKSAECGR